MLILTIFILFFNIFLIKSQLLIHSTHQPLSLISSNSRPRQCACPTYSSNISLLKNNNKIAGHKVLLKFKEEKKIKGIGNFRVKKSKREINLKNQENNKCNSERLKEIILKARGRDSTALKRNIQSLAEKTLSARFSVICARNDFSYITNTEEFCQGKINGNICYIFKQTSRELAFPDPPNLEQYKSKKNKET